MNIQKAGELEKEYHEPIYRGEMEMDMENGLWTLWGKERVGRILDPLTYIHSHVYNRQLVVSCCIIQGVQSSAL